MNEVENKLAELLSEIEQLASTIEECRGIDASDLREAVSSTREALSGRRVLSLAA